MTQAAAITYVALEQLDVVAGRPEENLETALRRSTAAFEAGADIVVLPELAISGYVLDPQVARDCAEPLAGASLQELGALARKYEGLIAYGFCEEADQGLYNSVALVGGPRPDDVALHYRKLHLFDREKDTFLPGNLGLPVAETPFGNIGICVCYDLRFVEVMRSLSLRGADLVLAPAAWVGGFDRTVPASGPTGHAASLLAQANLDQVAVVAVSQVAGESNGGPSTLGGSIACDAYGEILCGPLSRTTADSDIAAVDIAAVRSARIRGERIHPRDDRRTDVYALQFEGALL